MRIGLRMAVGALAGAIALSTSGYAQSLEDKLEQKMAKDFVKNANWVTDLETAKKQAKDGNKPIFAYFTRSYAP